MPKGDYTFCTIKVEKIDDSYRGIVKQYPNIIIWRTDKIEVLQGIVDAIRLEHEPNHDEYPY